jgi:hypothetical protein
MIDQQRYANPSRRSILRYLTARGWNAKRSRDGRFVTAVLSAQDPREQVELFFTDNTRPEVQSEEVAAAIRTISQLYELNLQDAARAVSALPFDMIVGRIPNEYVRNDSVELRLANRYIQSMRSFLASAATTEIVGQTFFRRTRKEAVDYAGRCRFAHTFSGSFGFVIESPVGLNDTPSLPLVDESKPFERKVVERIVRGLRSYRLAIAEEDSTRIASETHGFSANMCDDVIGVIEDTDLSKIDLSIQFSPEWKSELATEAETNQFAIERRYVDLLKDAATKLRQQETPQLETIVGRVVKLEAEGNPSDLFGDSSARDIVVSWDSPEYGLIRVQVPLTPQGYLDAVDAHKEGAFVSATGLLTRSGRSWSLTGEPKSIRIIQLTP